MALKKQLKDETSVNTQFLRSIAELSQRAFDLSEKKNMPNKVEVTQDVDSEEDHRLKVPTRAPLRVADSACEALVL